MGSKRENEGLSGPYWAEFRRLHRRLCRDIAPVDDRREALDGIYTLLLEARKRKKSRRKVYTAAVFLIFMRLCWRLCPVLTAGKAAGSAGAWKIGLGALARLFV